MPGKQKLGLEAGLRHQEAQATLQTLERQAKELESRHGEYMNALKSVGTQSLYQVGDCCFIKLGKVNTETMLRQEKDKLWNEIDNVQREIVRLQREVIMIEIEANLHRSLPS